MKIIHYAEAEAKKYPGGQAKEATGRVVIGHSDGAEKFCMRVFEIGQGGMTGLHAHDWEHEVFVHSGKGAVLQGELRHGVVMLADNLKHPLANLRANARAVADHTIGSINRDPCQFCDIS